jgi:4'-phosphopantetheinyl transferase
MGDDSLVRRPPAIRSVKAGGSFPSRPAGNEVHIWTIDLSALLIGSAVTACLSPDERSRASRYRFDLHRRRFEHGRGALRHILGGYLGENPGELVFQYGAFGKPEIDRQAHSGMNLHFNVSHTEDIYLCGVGSVPLGVDLEAINRHPEIDAIAHQHFAPTEWQSLRQLPPAEQPLGFTRCWTRKEAFIKAVGEGLSYPLDAFEVTLGTHEEARLLSIRGDQAEAVPWSMVELKTRAGYVGALVLKAHEPQIHYHDYGDYF